MEQRRPVNVFAQRRQRNVIQHPNAGKRWDRYIFGAPFNRSTPLAGFVKRYNMEARCGVSFAQGLVVGAMLFYERLLPVFAEQTCCDRHGATGIEHMNDWLTIVRRN